MSQNTLRVIAKLKAKPERAEALRTVLMGLIEPTRREQGCIVYEMLEKEQDPTEFVFVEQWRDGAALDAHFQTEHMKKALEASQDLLAADLDLGRYRLVG